MKPERHAFDSAPKKENRSFGDVLVLSGEFFMKKGVVFQTMHRLAERLDSEGIAYAVIGGMAMAAHGYVRMTLDVDVLVTPQGLERFRKKLLGRGYIPGFPGAQKTFRDTETQIKIEMITAGEFPGDGLPKPVAFPDPQGLEIEKDHVRVINLERLIELKLASGLSARDRLRDLADVQDLITTLDLPLEFMEKLDPSVRPGFEDIWKAAHKEI